MNVTIIDSLQDDKRLSTRELLDIVQEKINLGFNEFKILASGQHDIGGPLWIKNKDGDNVPLVFHITNPGQRVGSMGMQGTKIIVHGSAPADVGWLNAGAEIVVLGDGGDTTAHCCAGGKIYIGGRVGTRSGALMKHDPKFEEPEFWVLKNTGSFSFEFMGGGKAVVCGYDCEDLKSVLSNRSCCGMVGGTVYVRGSIEGLTSDVDIYPLNEEDKGFLTSGLKTFLVEIEKPEIYDELTDFSKWQKILAKPYDKKKFVPELSISEFRTQRWVKDGIFSEFFGCENEITELINTGENRLRVPSWDNNTKTPPCEFDCPVSIPTQKRIALLREGKISEALNLIYKYSPFPGSVCGQVCPNLCMRTCSRRAVDEEIKAAELGVKSFENIDLGEFMQTKNKTVAIIGSGVSGLSAAWQLLRLGYKIEIFEKDVEIGGKLRQVIPEERLNQDILNIELEILKSAIEDSNGKIYTSCNIDKNEFEHMVNNYDAIIVAVGAQNPFVIPVEGKERIIKGLDFLKEINRGNKFSVGENVVVIGAGNAAMDVVLGAYKVGAKQVTAIDIQKPAAFEKEIEAAKALGAKIMYPCFTEKVTEEGVYLTDGRLLKADSVIIAIGDRTDLSFMPDEFLNEKHQPLLNEFNQNTKAHNIFFAGDSIRQGLFCDGIGQGRDAALNINRFLTEKPLNVEKSINKIQPNEIKDAYYKTLRKSEICAMDVLNEKDRCLSCAGCRDCKMCLTSCPRGAIERVEFTNPDSTVSFAYVSDEKKCIGCGICAGVCPCGIWNMKSKLEG